MPVSENALESHAVNTIRTLAMDAVEAANSGHPGTPMALAPVAYVLFNEELRYDPADPGWPGRDRFVLSCGHASMLLYSMLHLAGVKQLDSDGRPTDEPAVSLEHIRHFRQLHSRCPGHPEVGHTSGVETTTGPLGQGVANSVGMAIAARWLAAQYNRPQFDLFGFNVYAMSSDGDLMEGVGSEAASLAGHLGLSRLIVLYDDNHISIDGPTDLAYSDDVPARFAAYGWHVQHVDGHDMQAVDAAIRAAQAETERPSLIACRTHIGFGSPRQDMAKVHGSPLGEEDLRKTKEYFGWDPEARFFVPPEVTAYFGKVCQHGVTKQE